MIYIATIHWKSSRWIDLQREMFQKYISAPFQVYAYLTGIDKEQYRKFHRVLDAGDPDHAAKLNTLAAEILKKANDEDWILFIDGDAFPVSNLAEPIRKYFQQAPLVAVQRLENLGEKHAHPCFCVTTVGFWKEIGGDWSKGYKWINALNIAETDVGGSLLYALTAHKVNWIPLHRSNKQDIVPVSFGIYGDLIYHHGAGFGKHIPRGILYHEGVFDIFRRWDARILNNCIPRKYIKRVRDSLLHPEGRAKRRIQRKLAAIEATIFKALIADPLNVIGMLRYGEGDDLLKRLERM